MKRKEKITVDLKVQQYNSLKLKQFDTTELEITVLDSSLDVDLSDLSIYIIFTKPDNKIVMQSSNIIKNHNIINAILLEDCLRMDGKAKIEVELKKDTEIVSSFYIPVQIERSSKENVTSDNTPNFIEILENASFEEEKRIANENSRKIAENNRAEAENSRENAETIRENNEKDRKTAESNRTIAETNRENVEDARNTAETNRENAENTRKTNENNRITAEQNRVEAEQARVEAESKRQSSYDSLKGIKHKVTLTEEVPQNTDYTLPCNYTVGNDSLEIYVEGILLAKDENYAEVGEVGQTSNKIQFFWDVSKDYTITIKVQGQAGGEANA